MKAERIDRVYVYVKDLNRATDFFSGFFGTQFAGPLEWTQPDVVQTAISPLGIALVQPRTQDGTVAKIIEKRGEGVGFVAVKVPSLEEALAESKARGIRVAASETMAGGRYKAALLHPADTFGVMIDLCEYNPQHPIMSVL